MSDLSLRNIDKYYGGFHAVRDVSFDIPAGEFVVLVGASGCGKSTLLRSIAGLEDISEGEVTLGGRPITALAPRDRNVAMVFQSYALYPYLSVRENIAFGLRARKTPEPEILKQVSWAADILDTPENCPAVSASAWPLGGPSSGMRIFICSMSRYRTLMPSCATACAKRSSACMKGWAKPSFM